MSSLTPQRGRAIIERMRDVNVVVYGDIMLDEFVWGGVTRISPEAPVPVVDVQRESVHLGGAANVLGNLIALGAGVSVFGLVGNDATGERVRAELEKAGASFVAEGLIVDASRPTTLKTRIIAHSQLVVRADRESRAPAARDLEDRLIEALQGALSKTSALIVSDYDKGAVTPRVLSAILAAARERGIPALVDPKFRNFDAYRRATLVTPNHHEALRVTNSEDDTDEGMVRAAQLIRQRLECDSVLITRGERGMLMLEGDGEGEGEAVFVGTVAREVYDVTGAGDTVIATLAGALAAGASLVEAAVLANHAAGIVVGKVGTATADADEMLDSLKKSVG